MQQILDGGFKLCKNYSAGSLNINFSPKSLITKTSKQIPTQPNTKLSKQAKPYDSTFHKKILQDFYDYDY